jgi:hypothetical protein
MTLYMIDTMGFFAILTVAAPERATDPDDRRHGGPEGRSR